MPFAIDPSAPRLPEDYVLQQRIDVEAILDGAEEICSRESDNDNEIWLLTKAGQFVRNTGLGKDRFYVVTPEEARVELQDLGCEDWRMAELVEAGALPEAPASGWIAARPN